MATKAKMVNKSDVRKLMKEARNKVASPLAKYNASGQLTCILCQIVVKNELLWPAHLSGKFHKENAANLKNGKSAPKPVPKPVQIKTGGAKRKSENGASGVVPSDFFQGASKLKIPKLDKPDPIPEVKPSGILKNKDKCRSIVKVADPVVDSTPVPSSSDVTAVSTPEGLPADFLDTQIQKNPEDDAPKAPKNTAESGGSVSPSADIPEGFFDDPVEDAKVHQRQYVDPQEAEWERFQKEIKMEAYKSEVILEEDDDVTIVVRNIEEIDEQLEGWAKVEALHVKKEAAFVKVELKPDIKIEVDSGEFERAGSPSEVNIKVEPKEEESDEDDDSDDEAGLEDLLDWRSKGT